MLCGFGTIHIFIIHYYHVEAASCFQNNNYTVHESSVFSRWFPMVWRGWDQCPTVSTTTDS